MSTITFAGTTIWNDASTGIGRPQLSEGITVTNWIFEGIPGNGSLIAKNNGIKPGPFIVVARYWLASGDMSGIKNNINNVRGSLGTLTFPPSTSESNCVLVDVRFDNTPIQPNDGTTHRYERVLVLQFQKLTV